MKKRTIRIIALVVALSLILSTVAFAATTASAYIAATNAWITRDSNDSSTVEVNFYIVGTNTMDQIGAKKILLYEQTTHGWILVKTYNYTDSLYASTLMKSNSGMHAGYVTYDGSASKGYYAVVKFYSEKDGGSDNYNHETPIG